MTWKKDSAQMYRMRHCKRRYRARWQARASAVYRSLKPGVGILSAYECTWGPRWQEGPDAGDPHWHIGHSKRKRRYSGASYAYRQAVRYPLLRVRSRVRTAWRYKDIRARHEGWKPRGAVRGWKTRS